ncbi:MAG: archaellin/type IV pilin N-terminal domain-containing protein [Candidatus Bathyarchaeia archaeon]
MHAKNMIESRKAISPILATLLLIVIAVAAIVVTYAWIMTYMSSAGQQAGVMLTKDAVSWPSNNSVKLYIRNIGTTDATINAIYMGTSASNLEKVWSGTATAAADGGVAEIIIDNYSWNNDTRYYFKVVPNTGAPLEFSEKSP